MGFRIVIWLAFHRVFFSKSMAVEKPGKEAGGKSLQAGAGHR